MCFPKGLSPANFQVLGLPCQAVHPAAAGIGRGMGDERTRHSLPPSRRNGVQVVQDAAVAVGGVGRAGVPAVQHHRRIVMAHQTAGGELCVALDEDQGHACFGCARNSPGPRSQVYWPMLV